MSFNMEVLSSQRNFSKWTFIFVCLVFLLSFHLNSAVKKIRFAALDECDRHSLDAIYNEKFKLITNNIFADSKEFVGQVLDKVVDSLISVMAEVPDRHASGEQEKKFHAQFSAVKKVFSGRVKKLHRNITSSWEQLIISHFDLMYDSENSSLEDYMMKTINMTEAYKEARRSMDINLGNVVEFVKTTVRDGLNGITYAAEDALQKEAQEKKENATKNGKEPDEGEKEEESKEDRLRKKKQEIAAMIVSGLLGKITQEVIKRNIDLYKKSGLKPEDRDNVFDDIQFDLLMIKNRINAFIQPDMPKDKGAIDLARRSVYMYYAEMAGDMYKERIRARKSSDDSGRLYYRKLWNDEEQLVETLMNLMELYP